MVLNNKSILIDANAWIAYVDADDTLYNKAGDYLELLDEQGYQFIITNFIIQEVLTILLYKKQIKLVENFLTYINTKSTVQILSIDTILLQDIIEFIKKCGYKPKISLTDWSLLFLATQFKIDLLTFDKQLNNTYKKLLI